MSMTAWIYIIKNILNANMSKYSIRKKILEECLDVPYKLWGMYQVNPNKIWTEIIMKDSGCQRGLERLKIDNVFTLMSYYEELEYQGMRVTYPHSHHRKG